MRALALTLLMAASVVGAETPAGQVFRVELFSRQIIESVILEAGSRDIRVCGAKTDGPCVVIPTSKKLQCNSGRAIRCEAGDVARNFELLTIDSATPFQVTPNSANVKEPPQTFVLQNVRVVPSSRGLRITTSVDLESYVAGVLRGEASVLHAPAARQAMGIVARTWARRWQGRHQNAGFDFCSLTHCQVFRPQLAKADRTDDSAVRMTQGKVLQFHGKPIDPYFTASCGGMTETAGNIWPDRAQPYLVTVHDAYCRQGSHAVWTQTLTAERLWLVLTESLHLPVTAPLTALTVEKRDLSGRAITLRAVAGGTWDIDANKFRYAVDRRLGWQQIKSNLYSIHRDGGAWVFAGRGLGHGVGLCQEGAEQMARAGSSAQRILATYFPGTEIAQLTVVDADPVASSEHFELVYYSSQEPWVTQTLDTLEAWRRQLGAHADNLPRRIRVQTWLSTADFVGATGEPGWMAAASDGHSIALQPLQVLGRKGILNQTLRHELTHLLVHKSLAKGVPRWWEEGAVLYLSGERIDAPALAFKTDAELEAAVTRPRSEAEMKGAYAAALKRVRSFTRRRGDDALWQALANPTDAHFENF